MIRFQDRTDGTQVIEQMGELHDAMLGHVTGTYLLVELPDGRVERIGAVRFQGQEGFDGAMVLIVDPGGYVPHHAHGDHPRADCRLCIGEDQTGNLVPRTVVKARDIQVGDCLALMDWVGPMISDVQDGQPPWAGPFTTVHTVNGGRKTFRSDEDVRIVRWADMQRGDRL